MTLTLKKWGSFIKGFNKKRNVALSLDVYFFKHFLVISCKGATKIYQTYEALIQDIQNNLK